MPAMLRTTWQFPILALAALLPASPAFSEVTTRPLSLIEDRMRGGWAGQMIGVSYGSIYEFISNGKPITGPLRPWKPEYVENSLEQDDIYVEVTFLKTLEKHGPSATAVQAAEDFGASQYRLWHANAAGRDNIRKGIMPPLSGHPDNNPHADDIDFQIESDIFGLISPGLPASAGAMCDVFGSLMNYGDGIYGGRFVAAMYSQAYLEDEPTSAAVMRCIETGLASIPRESAYAKVIRDVIDGHRRHPDDWLATWHELQQKWGKTDLCPDGKGKDLNIDAKLNGAYIVMGLLYGGGDMARTLEVSTRCGQDADCNPSNAAGVLGALYGYSRLPSEYTSGIPALKGKRFEYTECDYLELAEKSMKVLERVVREAGGRVTGSGDDAVVEIPVQTPQAPGRLEQMAALLAGAPRE